MMTSYKNHLDLNNFDEEEDLTDDEVFTRGGKSIPLEENGVNKPLMAPRHRGRAEGTLQTKVRKVPPCRVLWAPLLYGLIALSAVIGIICLVVFLINTFMIPLSVNNHLIVDRSGKIIIPCTNITTEDVWIKTFPMLDTETAIRLNDVNLDGTPDVIMGFGTGADGYRYPPIVCDVYFNNTKGCGGGLLALDGKTGNELWRHYTVHEIFAVNCNIDIDRDGVKDCLGGGRMAGFIALSGKDGTLLWLFNDSKVKIETSNFYTPIYVNDLDSDGLPDIITIHGGDPLKEPGSATRLVGRILIISSKSGKVLQWVEVPDKAESYYSPQVHTLPDGTELLLFGTGGETHGGSLWYIKLEDLLKGNIHLAKKIYTDSQKGIMTPPVLVDITGDNINDIVMAMFNSTVVAFNGLTFQPIWNFILPSSESYSTPGVGFFNDDDIPDFIINYQFGPGFPIYYKTQTIILDGRNGKQLLDQPINMLVGTQTSPLVISVEGFGNDIFLYWVSDCHGGKYDGKLEFDFVKGTSVHEQSRADFCKVRFKEKMFSKMYALTNHMAAPGITIYDSDSRKSVEYGNQKNYTAIGLAYRNSHRQKVNNYYYQQNEDEFEEPDDDDNYQHSHKNNLYNQYKDNYNNEPDGRYLGGGYIDESAMENEDSDGIHQKIYRPDEKSIHNHYPSPFYNKEYKIYGKHPSTNDYRYDNENKDPNNENSRDYDNRDWIDRPQNEKWRDRYEGDQWLHHREKENHHGSWNHRRPYQSIRNSKRHHLLQRKINSNVRNIKETNDYAINNKLQYRHRRHVGPHDGGSIQRLISTGAIFPLPEDRKQDDHSIDVVFATFWFFPAHTQVLFPEDKECIKIRMAKEAERFQPENPYYGMDHDAYEATIREVCLRQNGHHVDSKNSIYDNMGEYDPFNVPMGQMTVYRLRLSCNCLKQNLTDNTKCAKILPYENQGWTAYMGTHGNCLFNPHR